MSDANEAAVASPSSPHSPEGGHSEKSHKKHGKRHSKSSAAVQDKANAIESPDSKPGTSDVEKAASGASPSEKVSPASADKNAAASKGAGQGTENVKSAHEAPAAVPVNEERRPSSSVVPIIAGALVVLVAAVAVGVSLIVYAVKDARTTTPTADPFSCVPLQNLPTDAVVLETPGGRLVGSTVSTATGVKVNRWLGVPYANTSADQHRLALPMPLNATDKCETVLAMEPREPCAQWVDGKVLGSEDCWYLNVWAPTTKGNGTRPLVVAATGHWFQRSTNDVPEWAELAAQADAVVVAPNVRLGVLGFLHPRKVEGIIPDIAEQDMVVAIQWALDNAASFGADPAALMLVGNGSGAYMLVEAAANLSVTVAKAVVEGSMYISGMPANMVNPSLELIFTMMEGFSPTQPLETLAGNMDPSLELAKKLNCGKNTTLWSSCFASAQLDTLLSTAAQMELRFTPMWNPFYMLSPPPGKKVPKIEEVVAGADSAQVSRGCDSWRLDDVKTKTPGGQASAARLASLEHEP
ncbi:hypothetical protein HPB50_024873 [Hyalomma asiaticum]|uniref:Uncharacterized protein n=1 Tax=Hyalomma asiaticum TaxID=266040 RepID=A0ACB7RLZ5_HYAAI|nr:hypothetical protein HPB50_024873 [Hyalomma asiaticum]